MEYKIELIYLPVFDVDRAREFYTSSMGFALDHDQVVDEHLRFVQITPPGSACSICFGTGLSEHEPGTATTIQVVVEDIEQAHRELTDRGANPSDVEDLPWGSFIYVRDPDGNPWAFQMIPARDSVTTD